MNSNLKLQQLLLMETSYATGTELDVLPDKAHLTTMMNPQSDFYKSFSIRWRVRFRKKESMLYGIG